MALRERYDHKYDNYHHYSAYYARNRTLEGSNMSLGQRARKLGDLGDWTVGCITDDLTPHFEEIDGRSVFFMDGKAATVLTAEVSWWDLHLGPHLDNPGAYDYLYPAAREMGMNAIKVAVKWATVEPEPGTYDFTYIDHVKEVAECNNLKVVIGWFGHYASGDGNLYLNHTGKVFAPEYVIEDDERFPRAVDGAGVVHHNCASYDDSAIVEVETAAFAAFMKHLKQIDSEDRTFVMVQVENEIAVFGSDRQNRKMWRNHSASAESSFSENGFDNDLKYSAWSLTTKWLRPLSDAGHREYPLPFYVDFVAGELQDGNVGGSPGEDVQAYLENCPAISFCGLNLYTRSHRSVNDLRAALSAYQIGRNMPAITETNSDTSDIAPRLAFLSVAEFGAPIFAPWAINVSYPTPYEPYVLDDGSLANGAVALQEAYQVISLAMSPLALFAGTDSLKVFMGISPGERFDTTRDLNGAKVTGQGRGDGQLIVVRPKENEFIICGYRSRIVVETEAARFPLSKNVRAERGRFDGGTWICEGEAQNGVDQSHSRVSVTLTTPQVVRLYLDYAAG